MKFDNNLGYLVILTVLLSLVSDQCMSKILPVDCEKIKKEVLQRAADAVTLNETRDTRLTVDLYKKYSNCFDESQIVVLYEAEYARLKKLQKEQWWKIDSGWLTAVFFFIVLILRDYLKNVLVNLSKYIGQYFYTKFAGIKVFRRIAIRKYKTSLVQNFSHLHIPFKPGKPLRMDEVFVPLKAVDKSQLPASIFPEQDYYECNQAFAQLLIVSRYLQVGNTTCERLSATETRTSWAAIYEE